MHSQYNWVKYHLVILIVNQLKFNAQFRYRFWESEFTNSKPSNLIIGFMDKHLNKLENKVRSKIEDAVFG